MRVVPRVLGGDDAHGPVVARDHQAGSVVEYLRERVALDEVLQRFPSWEVDWEHAEQARTSTVRGWERLPVVFT